MKNLLKFTQTKPLAALAAILATSSALAQSFNIDYGGAFGATAPGYTGAAGQPGVWNNPLGPAAFPLVDITGMAWPTVIAVIAGGAAPFGCADPATGPADTALYDDGLAIGGVGAVTVFRVGPLLAGNYEIITYAWSPCQPAWQTRVNVLGSVNLAQPVGGAWPGKHAPCITYAHHAVVGVAAGGFIDLQLTTLVGIGNLNGLQIVRH